MGFRDDREATGQRVEILERDLAATQSELEATRLRVSEVDDLRKRLLLLTGERDALKRGAPPQQAARNPIVWAGLVVVAAAAACYGLYASARRQDLLQTTELARARADLERAEAETESVRASCRSAQSELAQIDGVHADELSGLQRQLMIARSREVGPALLVTAHVTARSGNVPDGTDDGCVMAIRDIGRGYCVASVTCGAVQVFPFNEPSADVRCVVRDGTPWTADGQDALVTATANVSSTSAPLLAYDADAHTLDVRETGAPVFGLRMRVTDVLPYRVR